MSRKTTRGNGRRETHRFARLFALTIVLSLTAMAAPAATQQLNLPAGNVLRTQRVVADEISVVGTLMAAGPEALVVEARRLVVLPGGTIRGANAAPVPPTPLTGRDVRGLSGRDGGDVIIRAQVVELHEGSRIIAGSGSAGQSVRATRQAWGGHGGNGGSVVIDAPVVDVVGAVLPGSGGSGGDAFVRGVTRIGGAYGGSGGQGGQLLLNGSIHRPSADSLIESPAQTDAANLCGPREGAQGTHGNLGNGGDGGDGCADVVGDNGGPGPNGSACLNNGGRGQDGEDVNSGEVKGGKGGNTFGLLTSGGRGGGASAKATGGNGGRGGDGHRVFGLWCSNGGPGGTGGDAIAGRATGGNGGDSCFGPGGIGGSASVDPNAGQGGAGGSGVSSGPRGDSGRETNNGAVPGLPGRTFGLIGC